MTAQQISDFEVLEGQLESFSREFATLVKKSPGDALNKFKLTLVNSVIGESNDLLGRTRKPFPDFDQFEDSELPSNSDVLMIIGQYLSAFEKLRADNVGQESFSTSWHWYIDDGNGKRSLSSIKTGPPRKIASKK